jgi:hypothetical protein
VKGKGYTYTRPEHLGMTWKDGADKILRQDFRYGGIVPPCR